VGNGYGLNLDIAPKLEHTGTLLLRFDLGLLEYGRETKTVCLSTTIGCRVTVDVTTSNDIVVGGVGPEIVLPRGRVRPYGTATVGFAYFFTHSSVEGTNDIEPFADTKNFDDFVFAWTAGGGLRILLRESKRPIALDLGVRYHGNGEASYLREGSIIDNPDGSITIQPIRSRTNFVAYHLGVSFEL
jgi:opacity protein-like surface antigen